MSSARITPRAALCLVGLSNGMTWREIATALKITERTVARHIASARLALGENNPSSVIQKSALIQKAVAAGVIQPGMVLTSSGYLAFSVGAVARGERI